jgi:hypothetical protein
MHLLILDHEPRLGVTKIPTKKLNRHYLDALTWIDIVGGKNVLRPADYEKWSTAPGYLAVYAYALLDECLRRGIKPNRSSTVKVMQFLHKHREQTKGTPSWVGPRIAEDTNRL